MAEAGATWSRLATTFGAAAAEYEAIIVSLRGAWQSATSAGVHDRVSALRDWLAGAAQAAAANAAKAVRAAIAAMPRERTCPCASALKFAILTSPEAIPAATKAKLDLLLGKYTS